MSVCLVLFVGALQDQQAGRPTPAGTKAMVMSDAEKKNDLLRRSSQPTNPLAEPEA